MLNMWLAARVLGGFVVSIGLALPVMAEMVMHHPIQGGSQSGTYHLIADGSGFGNHAVPVGTVSRFAAGWVRWGAGMSDGYLEVADSASLDLSTGMTLSAWIWGSGFADGGIMFKGALDGTPGVFDLAGDGTGGLSITIRGPSMSTESAQAAAVLPEDDWVHVAATFDGDFLRLFVDGTEVAVQDVVATELESEAASLYMGQRLTTQESDTFAGNMDEVRIYDTALLESEIQTLMLDTDGDGVPDLTDNCIAHPNGPLATIVPLCASQQVAPNIGGPSDGGFGIPCDVDLDGDNASGIVDGSFMFGESAAVSTSGIADLNCDGAAGLADVFIFFMDPIVGQFIGGQPGPSCVGGPSPQAGYVCQQE